MQKRIIFLDLMRALAVIMMVEGHTVDVLLGNEYRNYEFTPFAVWAFLRGLTAPIFLFTAGTVFIYLLKNNAQRFRDNPRVMKGVRRFLLLVSIGYLLRYPTSNPTSYAYVSEESWKVFFAVDTLQLIGFGLLFLLGATFLAEKLKISEYHVFSGVALIFFLGYPIVEVIAWTNYLPSPIAGYLYTGTGSNFPLFPWAGYVLSGGVLGCYLTGKHYQDNPNRLGLWLGSAGVVFIGVNYLILSGSKMAGQETPMIANLALIFLRLGLVVLLSAAISMVTQSIRSIPRMVVTVGRRSLMIYVVHLVILYGSAWNNGIYHSFEKSFSLWQTIGAATLMILAMIGLALAAQRGSALFKNTFALMTSRFNWRVGG